MLLELNGICRNYGSAQAMVAALKKVSLNVEEGEYIAIMGPSGSGKTTLMNILGCLDRADEGTYMLDGIDISSVDENHLSDIRLNKIGFVFQTFQLLASDTALDNVALPLIYAGVKKGEREKRALEALTKVGLEDRASFYPNQLSGGQKQRVAIARAMINNPRILLADEPTGALDQASGKAVMELFEKLNSEGTTVIMITHDANVANHAKRIMYIIDGELSEGKAGDAHED
ncbi:MAG: ABC transporter ATP-binding protein [Erysipelotrichaceae bacterium]|nr:ABC transporter ATP-binding protein [Erysipelotrichaceae bacterium]